jgi:hypothetical protein
MRSSDRINKNILPAFYRRPNDSNINKNMLQALYMRLSGSSINKNAASTASSLIQVLNNL